MREGGKKKKTVMYTGKSLWFHGGGTKKGRENEKGRRERNCLM